MTRCDLDILNKSNKSTVIRSKWSGIWTSPSFSASLVEAEILHCPMQYSEITCGIPPIWPLMGQISMVRRPIKTRCGNPPSRPRLCEGINPGTIWLKDYPSGPAIFALSRPQNGGRLLHKACCRFGCLESSSYSLVHDPSILFVHHFHEPFKPFTIIIQH